MAEIKQRFTQKLFGSFLAAIGVISGILGIYTFYFQDKKNELTVEVLANTNVLDINAEVTKLDVIYNGNSLNKRRQSLRIYNIAIRNTGNESVLKTFYDLNDPLGLRFSGGTIVKKPEILKTSSEYISKNIKISFDSSRQVSFNDIILEPNDFYNVKVLVLHPSNSQLSFSVTGKVAGIKDIQIVSLNQTANLKPSIWYQTFNGTVLVQFLRLFLYSLILLLIFGILITIASGVTDRLSKKDKRRTIQKFKLQKNRLWSQIDEAIFRRFTNNEFDTLKLFHSYLNQEGDINEYYQGVLEKYERERQKARDIEGVIKASAKTKDFFIIERSLNVYNGMINDGLILKQDDKLVVNQTAKQTLDDLILFLRTTNYKDKFGEFGKIDWIDDFEFNEPLLDIRHHVPKIVNLK